MSHLHLRLTTSAPQIAKKAHVHSMVMAAPKPVSPRVKLARNAATLKHIHCTRGVAAAVAADMAHGVSRLPTIDALATRSK